jgi:predicted NBD/HSP70 family sugar kinase
MKAVGWRVGIDLGGTSLRLLAENASGDRTKVVTMPTARDYSSLLDQIETQLGTLIDGDLLSIGFGICGTSDGTRPLFVPALPWIEQRALGEDLSHRFSASVVIGMDGHYTLLAEAMEGSAVGDSSAVLVADGTGIGGAVMFARKIWRGAHGSAGSFGWLTCVGGQDDSEHGRFEQVASGTALTRTADAYRPGWTGVELMAAARAGDAQAAALAARFGEAFGRGLAALASMLDPEVIVVAGGISNSMDVLSPSVDRAMLQYASPNGRHVPVRPARLGSHAGVIGALLATTVSDEIWL